MAKKKVMGLPISPAPLTMLPAIFVRNLICPQLGGPAVCLCLTGSHLLTRLPAWPRGQGGQESTPVVVVHGRNGPRPGQGRAISGGTSNAAALLAPTVTWSLSWALVGFY
jgi:hypothetical protein